MLPWPYMPIKAIFLSMYFCKVENGFGSTLQGLKFCLEIIPKVEESLIGLI